MQLAPELLEQARLAHALLAVDVEQGETAFEHSAYRRAELLELACAAEHAR